MRLPEQKLWDALSRHGRACGLLLERIENVLASGTPDVHGLGARGGAFWIEMKVAKTPARAVTPVFGAGRGLTTDQENWLLRYAKAGGRAFVLARSEGCPAGLWLVEGALAASFNQMPAAALDSVAVARGWDEIMKELLK